MEFAILIGIIGLILAFLRIYTFEIREETTEDRMKNATYIFSWWFRVRPWFGHKVIALISFLRRTKIKRK